MKTELKGWLADNIVTIDNKEDKILVLEGAGNLTLSDVLDEMKKEDTGLRAEALKHAVDLSQRTVSESVLNGYSVSMGLFRTVPQFRRVTNGEVWNSEKNSTYVSFSQNEDLREAIVETKVKILGAKGDPAYFIGGGDAATRATDGSATAGRNYCLQGKNVKVTGADSAVGIALIDEKGTETKLSMDMIAVNNSSEVLVLLPADLKDGVYELRLTTQFSAGNKSLKVPRTVMRSLVIGLLSGGDGDTVDDPTAWFLRKRLSLLGGALLPGGEELSSLGLGKRIV